LIGTTLGHYEITSQLGEGGMGVVYQATDTRLNREVAIKVLPAPFLEDAERLARLEREAQLLASLNHSNIGGIYGLEEDGQRRFLVLELIGGETLAERLARGALPLGEALAIGTQIARALEAAHERGIVHRDLKPANVKLTPDDTVKVLDFGLAKAWDRPAGVDLSHSPTLTARMTQAGVILGTAAYMSPEQARGKPADKRADIWSFGVVLWEMLTGRKLFAGETVSDVLAAVLRAEPAWDDLPPRLPRGVRRVLERCLAKGPDERLHDIADARIELDEVKVEASSPALRARAIERAPLSRLRLAALGALIALVAAAGSLYLDRRLGRESGVRPVRAGLRLDLHLGDLWIPKGLSAPSYVALSPDGTHAAFSAIDAGSTQRLYVRSLAELDARPLAGTEGAACPFFSPDGQQIGFEADDKLKVVGRDGGAVRTLAAAPNMRGATWGASGVIVFATGDGQLWRISERGGEPVVVLGELATGERELPRWPALLPGDREVLFTTLSPSSYSQASWQLNALSLDSGEHRVLLDNAGAARFLPPDRLVFVRGGNDYDMAGSLYVAAFDPTAVRMTGEPREALQGVHLGQGAATPYFDVSQGGTLIYAPTHPALPARRLVWVDRTGAIEPAFPPRGAYEDPRLSPDGTRVALSVGGDIRVLDLGRGTETRLTTTGGAALPIWAPDGRRLIFEVSSEQSGFLLYEADIENGSVRPLSTHRAGFPNFVSPDGRRVLFSRQLTSAQWDLVELSLDDDEPAVPWLASEELEIDARLAPGGRWAAFRAGRQIVVRPYPGPGTATIVSPSGGREPAWSPDGRELYYLADSGEMMVVPVSTGETFSAGAPRPLFELPEAVPDDTWRTYDVAPDGDRFLLLLGDPKEVEPLRLVYVPGWVEQIESTLSLSN
jgi:serine/threonine-protein kinase